MSFEQADLRSIFLTNIIREEWNLHFVKPDLINVVRKIYIKLKKEDLINIMDEFDCIYLYSTNKYYSNLNATINGKVSTFVPQKNIFGEESNKDNQRKIEETKVQIKTKISPNFFNYHEKTKFHPLFLIIEKKIQDDDILIIELSYYISNYDSSYLPIFAYKKAVKFKKTLHSALNFINRHFLFIEPIFTVDINILSYKVSIYIFIQAPENYELKSNIKQVLYENEKYEIEKEVTKKQVQKNNSEIYRLSHDGGLYEHTTIPTVKRTKLLGFKKKKQGNEEEEDVLDLNYYRSFEILINTQLPLLVKLILIIIILTGSLLSLTYFYILIEIITNSKVIDSSFFIPGISFILTLLITTSRTIPTDKTLNPYKWSIILLSSFIILEMIGFLFFNWSSI